MKNHTNIAIIPALVILLYSCSLEERPLRPSEGAGGGRIVTGLQYYGFDGDEPRTRAAAMADYDRVELLVVDEDGDVVRNVRLDYEPYTALVYIEGLQPGGYSLLVAGVKGDADRDRVEFSSVGKASEVWMSFPESNVVESEYFYSSTPFSVWPEDSPDGVVLVSDMPAKIEQRRVVGRMDFRLRFNNPYTEYAVVSARAVLYGAAFCSGLKGDGTLAGEPDGGTLTLDLMGGSTFILPPAVSGNDLEGAVEVLTRNYLGDTVFRRYSFRTGPVAANRISSIEVAAVHPDDGSGTMFVTARAYENGGHRYILQDDEHHSVYTDSERRSFNTSRPLQVSVTEDGRLNVRFYSPKPVRGVLIRALVPSVGKESLDLAYFDEVPAFADFYGVLPALSGETVFRTESGRIVSLPVLTVEELRTAEFSILSEDPYWVKLEGIRHGWNIRFNLFGGDPTKPDGGPNGNWMGIRPVHCREAVAFFLNFSYLTDMPEHEALLRANEDLLYGNGGVDDKVSPETVLAQMREERNLNVGLVYTGNNVYGLGAGGTFGIWQGGWLEHYTSAWACEMMFHELGHVLGYSHSSAFTYGPWAQGLMNNFYVNNISEMPVESSHWLGSKANPNIYK